MDSAPSRRRLFLIAIACACTLSALLACAWLVAHERAERRIAGLVKQELLYIERSAEVISHEAERRMSVLRGVPALLAGEQALGGYLARVYAGLATEDSFDRINRRLAEAARELRLDAVLLLDSNGVVVAASNHRAADSTIGAEFLDRAYYLAAMEGKRGEQYLVGRRTGVAGLFFSAPVRVDDEVAGALVIKLDMPKLSALVGGGDSFITDANGVIILASDQTREMRMLETGDVHRLDPNARSMVYMRTEFETLPIRSLADNRHPRMVRVGGDHTPQLIAHALVPGSELQVHVMARLDEVATIRSDARWAFALFGATAIGVAAGLGALVLYVLAVTGHRKELGRVNGELRRLNTKLHQEATTDALTECMNRRRFMEILDIELARGHRHGGTMSVLIADIDYFKRVNDTYGHAIGDLALQHFASVAKQLMRREDALARLGGEEFVFLLPLTTGAGALNFAERVRFAIESQPLIGVSVPIALTVSIGVASCNRAEMGSSLLERADHALYSAKRGGRNRVAVAPTLLAA